jgi:hypothetical protein
MGPRPVVRDRALEHSGLANQNPLDGGGPTCNSNESTSVSTCTGDGQ